MVDAPASEVVVLGDAMLDMAQGTLTRGGQIVPLRAKSFRVLCELARQPGRVVTKNELLDAIWPGIHVTENSLTQAIRDIRRSLNAENQNLLRTVARRGFVLVPSEGPVPRARAAAPRGPRVAVLPLQNQTGLQGWGTVIEGLVEEITSGLARFRSLTVLARHSAFAAAAGPSRDMRAVGASLGADFLVDGSVHLNQGAPLLRIALNDATGGEVLWGDSFLIEGPGWLTLQDLIPRRIVATLFGSLDAASLQGSFRRLFPNLSTFEHLARGRALIGDPTQGASEQANAHFLAALAADPGLGQAHSYLGLTEMATHHYGFAPQEVKERAKSRAQLAVELSPEDSTCHGYLAWFRSYLREFEAAEQAATRAVELNPCDSDALFALAHVMVLRGRAAEALDWLARAKEVNPFWPEHYEATAASALYDLGRYEDSIRALMRLPRICGRQEMRLAAAYAQLGCREAARRHAARARALLPCTDLVAMTREAWISEHIRELDHMVQGIETAVRLLDEG